MCAPRFTGRDRELAELTEALSGPPAVIMVEGEAGIGKTRLIEEFLSSRGGRGHQALLSRCPPFRQPHTLGPVADALRQAARDVSGLRLSALAGAVRPLFPEWSAGLPPLPAPAEDATAARHRLFRALAELLDSLAVNVLLVEDAHWADEATVEFLLFLASCQPRALSLVITCRPEDVSARSLLPRLARQAAGSSGLHLALGPLAVEDTAKLVSSMLAGGQIAGEFAAFLHERTEGVPLAIEESVRLMAARGDIFRRRGELVRRQLTDITIAPAIRNGVLERARRLSRQAQAMLWAAAVLGDPADDATLRSVAGIGSERARDGLSAALECGLLAEAARGLMSFRHVLAARAVYEAIPAPQRKILHLRAGHALERTSPPPLARLVYHFREAGEADTWCRYAERAADLALASGDETTAAALLHDLVVNAGLPPRAVARLTSKISFVSPARSAGCEELIRALRAILDAGNLEPGEEAEVRVQLGRVLGVVQEFEAGRAELERAVPHLPPGSVTAARVMLYLGWATGSVRPAPVHLGWLRRAAKVTESPAPAERLRLLTETATGLLLLGEKEGWAAAARVPRDSASPAEWCTIAGGNANIAEAAIIWGRYPEARQRLAAALDMAERHHYLRFLNIILVYQAHLDWFTGAWNGLAGRASSLADAEDVSPVTRLDAVLVTALLDAATGARGQALERFHEVAGQARQHGSFQHHIESAAALARLHVASGQADDALQATAEPVGVVTDKGFWVLAADVVPARADALAAAGRIAEAAKLTAALGDGLRRRAIPAPRAALITCRGIVAQGRGDHARAAGLFARAAAAWQALPRPYDSLLARERQANSLLAAGRREVALELLAEVQRGLSGLGATWDARRVAGSLREHGVAVPGGWRGGRRGYGGQLSPRELEVVGLVAAGRTNKQIAAALCRSPKTVDTQLNSAMRKLGVSSRTALAVSAVRAGLTPGSLPAVGP
jgi:DNA-binding CsgD family transcriptional regulator/tetratricopeptide (TPR) repeat protein